MLVAQDLRLAYGKTTALDGFTLRMAAGETLGLLGPNGAGKSSFIAVASGILRPASGSIEFAGLGSPTDPEVRRHLGVAPQELAIYPQLSTRENLAFFARLQGLWGANQRAAIDRGLEFSGLESKVDARAATLSGGMLRRLNLALAVLHRPKLLLLDEPTAGVDPQSRAHLHANLAELRQAGTSILYTSHLLDEVEKVADRVAIVDHGKVLIVDDVASIVRQLGPLHRVHATSCGVSTRYTTDTLAEELSKLSKLPDLERLTIEPLRLEDIYLELTGTQPR